jgi:hypothetical protein
VTNLKIEKVRVQIAKTKDIIAEYQAKLRELEKQKIDLENLAVVAMFRKEKLDEDEFSALLHSMQRDEPVPQTVMTAFAGKKDKEDLSDGDDKI